MLFWSTTKTKQTTSRWKKPDVSVATQLLWDTSNPLKVHKACRTRTCYRQLITPAASSCGSSYMGIPGPAEKEHKESFSNMNIRAQDQNSHLALTKGFSSGKLPNPIQPSILVRFFLTGIICRHSSAKCWPSTHEGATRWWHSSNDLNYGHMSFSWHSV